MFNMPQPAATAATEQQIQQSVRELQFVSPSLSDFHLSLSRSAASVVHVYQSIALPLLLPQHGASVFALRLLLDFTTRV